MYSIHFNRRCKKILLKLPKKTSKRIIEKINKLINDPVPHNAIRINSVKDKMFRLRVGEHRILYVTNHEKKEIYIKY